MTSRAQLKPRDEQNTRLQSGSVVACQWWLLATFRATGFLPLSGLEGRALRMKGWLRIHLEDPYAAQIIDQKVEGQKAVTSLGAVKRFSSARLQEARELQVTERPVTTEATVVLRSLLQAEFPTSNLGLCIALAWAPLTSLRELSTNSVASLSGNGCHVSALGRSKSCRLPHC